MTDILVNGLADYIIAEGVKIPVRTDFRHWLKVINAAGDGKTDISEILESVLLELPQGVSPLSIITAMGEFITGGQERGKACEGEELYSFSNDGELILAAFLGQYNIDLTMEELHYHKFLALLKGLSEETMFVKVMGIRAVKLSSIESGELRESYRKLKELWALPKPAENRELLENLKRSLSGAKGVQYIENVKL